MGGSGGGGDLCTAVGSLDNNGVLTWRPPPLSVLPVPGALFLLHVSPVYRGGEMRQRHSDAERRSWPPADNM